MGSSDDRTAVLANLRVLVSHLALTHAELLSLAVHTLPEQREQPLRGRSRQREANGWHVEHDFRSWRRLFELEMEERLVRAHKDYHESVQSGLNSAVQALSALVAVLGTISLVLFTDTHTETNEEAGASSGNATGTTAVGPDEQVVNDLQDTGIFSPRWWLNIVITLASLLATGLSNLAGRRGVRTAELVKSCEKFFNTQKDLIQAYRRVLEVPVVERPTYAEFQESVRDLQTREEHFVSRQLSNTQKFWALFSVRTWDKPAFNRYFRFCVEYDDRELCGLTFCNLLNFAFGPVIKRFEFIHDQQRATQLLYYFSDGNLCSHLDEEQLKSDDGAQALSILWLRHNHKWRDLEGATINMQLLIDDLDDFMENCQKEHGVVNSIQATFNDVHHRGGRSRRDGAEDGWHLPQMAPATLPLPLAASPTSATDATGAPATNRPMTQLV